MKKLISLILAIIMVTGCAVIISADEPSDWAKEEVTAAIAAGLVPSELQKNYTSPVTRGQVAQMFINLLERSYGKPYELMMEERGLKVNPASFTDTTDDYVLAANAFGIINGTGQNKFSPDGTLKRAQIAAIINRVAKVLGINTTGYSHGFTDITDNYAWADPELGWPVANGIIKGVGGTKFSPGGDLTTEQAILITYRAYGVLSGEQAMFDLLALLDMPVSEILWRFGNMELLYSENGPGAPVYSIDGLPGVSVMYSKSMYTPLENHMLPTALIVTDEYGKPVCGISVGDRLEEKAHYADLSYTYNNTVDGTVFIGTVYDYRYRVTYAVNGTEAGQPEWDATPEEWSAFESQYLQSPVGTVCNIRISPVDLSGRDYNEKEVDIFGLLSTPVSEIRSTLGELTFEYSEHGPGAPVYSIAGVPGVMLLFLRDMDEPLTDDLVPDAVILTADYGKPIMGLSVGGKLEDVNNITWGPVSFDTMSEVLYASTPLFMSFLETYLVTCLADLGDTPVPGPDTTTEQYDAWVDGFINNPYGTIIGIRITRADIGGM